MSRSSILTQNQYPSPIGYAPGRSKLIQVIAVLICGLFLIAAPAFAEKVLLNQTLTVSDNGSASNLFVPAATTLYLDYKVGQGKEILLMVITDEQFQAISAGEKPSGKPVLRTTVSGANTASVHLERGAYVVFMSSSQGTTQVTLRARADIQ